MASSAPAPTTPIAVTFGEALVVLVQDEAGPLEQSGSFRRSLGGAEANVAIGLTALGVPTAAITRVGDDGFGRFIRSELRRLDVEVAAIAIDPVRTTGLYVKEVGGGSLAPTDLGTGRSRMHYYRKDSAGAHLSPGLLEEPAVAALLSGAALVHTTGITPALSGTAAAAQRALVAAVQGRALVSFDLNWRPQLWRGREEAGRRLVEHFLRTCDIALAGQDEAEQVFGTTSPDELRRLFPEPRRLIVKNDGGAVVAFDGSERVKVPVPAVVDVVESIGAGDAFAAGLLAGILHRLPLTESVQLAHRTAARALSSIADHVAPGGGAGTQTIADALDLAPAGAASADLGWAARPAHDREEAR